jgi:hypothetical protein
MKNLNEEIGKSRKELVDTDNFIVKYLPFKTLNYIYDIMKAVLPGRAFYKQLLYMKEIYAVLEY